MTPGGGALSTGLLVRGVSSLTYRSCSSLLVGDGALPWLLVPVPLLTVVPSIEGLALYSGAPWFGLGADIVE